MRMLQRQRRLTRWSLLAERIARAFWPLFTVVCLTLAFALLGGFSALGPLGHRIALGLVLLLIAAALIVGGMRLRTPTSSEIDARLDEGNRSRPLAILSDELAVGRGADQSESIWRAHLARAREAAVALRARLPDLRLSKVDTWALRLVAPALLVGALIGTNGNFWAPVDEMMSPAPVTQVAAATDFSREPAAEAWASPPPYTGLSTIYMAGAEPIASEPGAPVRIPVGSRITLRVTDSEALPALEGGALAGIEEFTSLGGGLAEATGIVTDSGDLSIQIGEEQLARWAIEVIPDHAPEITLDGRPTTTVTRAMDLAFSARDDYGISAAWAEIAPEGHDPENARGLPLPVINFGLPLPITGDAREVDESAIRDFSAHPWAGAQVIVKLFAEDGAEQVGEAEPMAITLPARLFGDPMARALVEQRRELALDYGQAHRVLDVLQAITRRPHEIFDDAGVYLTVRIAIRRLAQGVGSDEVAAVAPGVIEFLWRAALALEDGDLSAALERLRQAQEALRQALESGTEEDIRRAMDELRAALNEYLQQLARQQQRNPNQQMGQQQQQGQQLSQQDLQEMLDRLQQQAESGMRDQAREMLSELNRMLENLQAAQQSQQQGGQGQQALQELQDMIQRQRDLSDRTFDELRQRRREQQLGQGQPQQGQNRNGQQQGQQQPGWGEGQGRGDEHGQQGQQGEMGRGDNQSQGGAQQGGGGLAQQQEALRRELEALSRGLGSEDAARALEEAARAMGDARDDLQDGANSDAVRDQMDALDRLNEGADALAQEMRNGQGDAQAQGNRRGQGQGRDNAQNDPFDRPTSSFGALDGRSTKVPEQTLIDRARELMQELRRRAAEPSRPQLELDYLDRLMDRF